MPPPLQQPLPAFGAQRPAPKAWTPPLARPAKMQTLPDNLDEEDYVERFLDAFGTTPGKPVAFRDAAGHAVAVGRELFKAGPGGPLKLTKRDRHRHLLHLAEALQDPDEIWVDWAEVRGKPVLRRRYLRAGPKGLLAVLEWTSNGWHGTTAFQSTADYLRGQRPSVPACLRHLDQTQNPQSFRTGDFSITRCNQSGNLVAGA